MPDSPSTAGSTLSGAASGAAAGTAVFPGVGTLIGAGVGALGGYLSASGTASAQSDQNRAAAQAAAAQSAQSFLNYLSGRGVNIQQIVANDPRGAGFWQQQYAQSQAKGDKRDFNTWFVAALQAAPSDPIWTVISSPTVGNGAQNTTLPAWALDAQGNPLQPSLLAQLVGIQSGANSPATAPISTLATVANTQALLDANPEIAAELAAAGVGVEGGDDTRSAAQWLADHIAQTEQGNGRFSQLLRNFATAQASGGDTHVAAASPGGGAVPTTGPAPITQPGPAGTGNNTTLDPAIAALIPKASATLGGVFDGTYLNQLLAGQKPIDDARLAEAAAQRARIDEQRGLSGDLLNTQLGGIADVLAARQTGAGGIYDATLTGATGVRDASRGAAQGVYDANVQKLADLLGVRKEAAQAIYDASAASAGGVRDARNTGAQGIYGAELTQADTYGAAAQQAVNRLLAQQQAERARRGFTGGSSGSDIVSARLNADYLQRGAGARAQAGTNLQNRLSESGIGYATDIGRAGVGRATTIGAASEQDATAKLNAAVDLAKQLGLADTNFATTSAGAGMTRATTLAGAGEQNSIANLQARVADATRRLGYLTSDADIAKAQADLKNAQDALALLSADQNRKIGAIGAPFNLAGLDLGLKGQINAQQYTGIDDLLKRLGSFGSTPAGGPNLTVSQPGSVINDTQMLGAGLSSLGSAAGNYYSNQQLAALIAGMNAGRNGNATPSTTSPTGFTTPGGNVGVQTDWKSVFG